ncbi:MAG: phosphoribosylaminoimidazolesuccinocarboxamide synthase [Desulfobacterales bacterium]
MECVVRGYISDPGWKSYQEDGTVCGISLPSGLKESEQLPELHFHPVDQRRAGGP